MHYSLSLPTVPPWPIVSITGAAAQHDAERDPRWHSLVTRLKSLRRHKRRAVRIVDVNCGDGTLLIQAVRLARSLGFLAIEALGVDSDADHIDDARDRARMMKDTAVGLDFQVAEAFAQLQVEADFPADIILYDASARAPKALRDAAARAGNLALRREPSSWEHRA